MKEKDTNQTAPATHELLGKAIKMISELSFEADLSPEGLDEVCTLLNQLRGARAREIEKQAEIKKTELFETKIKQSELTETESFTDSNTQEHAAHQTNAALSKQIEMNVKNLKNMYMGIANNSRE